VTRWFARTPRLPLRCYLEVGLQEWVLLPMARHLRDVLDAREYPLTYAEYNGGHDFACWRGGWRTGCWPSRADRRAEPPPARRAPGGRV
jgi:enterochelin esterase family protein